MKKGKRMFFYFWLVALAIFSFIFTSCNVDENTTVNTSENEGYAEMKVLATVYGQVIDALSQQPVAGVRVRIEGDKTYSATTDSQGFYRISNVYLGTIKALNGGGSGDDWGSNSVTTKTLTKTFPLFIDGGNKYATWQKNISLSVSYDLTAAGSVVLQSDTSFKLDTVQLYRKLDTVEVKVFYANGTAAANATVVFQTYPWSSFYMENSQVVARTNSEGIAEVEGLIAYDNYYVYAWAPEGDFNWYNFSYSPYYEDDYFSLWWWGYENINLTPCGPYVDWNYDDDEVVQENDIIITLNNPQSVGLVASNIDDLDNLPTDDTSPTLFFLFNLPVDATFNIVDKAGNAIAINVSTTDNMWYEITFVNPLDPNRGPFDVMVSASAANGKQYSNTWEDAIDFPGANNVMLGAVAPSINLNRLNAPDYTGYRVDWDKILLGDGDNNTPYGSATYTPSTIELSWPVVEDAIGYRLYVSNNDTWQDVTSSMNIFYNDGVTVKAQVSLPNVFDAWHNLDLDPDLLDLVFAPWYGGQVLKFKILPVNANGNVDISALNMNTPFLSLADNWGPEIVNSNIATFGTYGRALNFDGVNYDAEVNIPFDEPVELDNLTANPDEGQYGVSKESGYFDIASVSWPDPDPVGELPVGFYLQVQLEPTNATEATVSANASAGDTAISVNALGPLCVGDTVQIGDSEYTVDGFSADQNILYLDTGLTEDITSGTGINLLGPTKGQADLTIATTGTYYTDRLVVNDGSGFSLGDYILIDNQTVNRVLVATTHTINLLNAIDSYLATGTTIEKRDLTATALVAAAASANDTELTLNSVANFEVGDLIAIGSWDNTYRVVSIDTTTNTITISPALTSNVAAGAVVYRYTVPATPVETTLLLPAPVLQVGSTTGIAANGALSIGDETATVVGVYDTYVGLDHMLTGTYAGADVSIDISNVRQADILKVQVRDKSGNLSSDTDEDGDGNADYDEVDGNNDIF